MLVTCEAGTLTCSTQDRRQAALARFSIEAPLRCTPTIAAGRVLLAGCDSQLHIIDVATGKETDTVEIDAPTGSTPAMRDERVYFGTEGGTFYAIDMPADGDKKPTVAWTYRDPQRGQPIRAAAAVTDQVVVYGSQGKAIYALDPATGERKVEAADAQPRRKLAGDRRQPRRRRDRRRVKFTCSTRRPAK